MMDRDDYPDRMNREQAAKYLGVSPGTLAVWASTGKYDLPYYKAGANVMYFRADMDAWLYKRRQN